MICNQCNNKIPDDSEYCQFCGNIIENKTVESTTVSDVEKGYTYLELKEWKKAKEIFDFAILNNDNKAKAYIGRLLANLKLSDLSCLSSINKSLTKFDDFNLANKYADEDYKNLLDKCYSLVEEKIRKKKVKSKKIALISSISFMSIIIVSTLSYFVFIPWGRFFYYEKLLSNGKVKKAINSFSNSKFYEYDEKAIELFYNKGVSLVENKDYKNAEICFNNTKDFKDSNNYSIYCKGKNLLAKNDLDSYNYFMRCKDFLDSKKIVESFYNKSVSMVKNKNYKNAENCFYNIKDYKDANNYYNYCKGQNLLAENDLDSYNYFTECKDFLDSKKILETNKYFILVNNLQGVWKTPTKSFKETEKNLIDNDWVILNRYLDEEEPFLWCKSNINNISYRQDLYTTKIHSMGILGIEVNTTKYDGVLSIEDGKIVIKITNLKTSQMVTSQIVFDKIEENTFECHEIYVNIYPNIQMKEQSILNYEYSKID